MKPPKRLLLGTLVLMAAASAVAWTHHSRTATTATTATANHPLPDAIGCLGRIEPASRIRRLAQPESMGNITVAELHVIEGQLVEAGTLLARFGDHARRAAAVNRARAELGFVQGRLAQVRAGAKPAEIEAAAARVQREESRVASARRELLRRRQLIATGAATAAEADSRETELRIAEAELEVARETAAALAEVRAVDVALAEADVARARASLELAQAEAALAELRAPIASTILRIHTRTGESVGPSGVLELADLSRIDAVAEVYETDAPRVRPGATAEVILPGGRRLPGRVSEVGWSIRKQDLLDVDPVGDIDTRVVEARVRLDPSGAGELTRLSHLRVQVVIHAADQPVRSTPTP